MTPLVRDYIETRGGPAKTVRSRMHIRYVDPDDLKEGDLIVDPSATQLAGFGDDEFDGDHSRGTLLFKPGLLSREPGSGFAEMEWQDAVVSVRDLGNSEYLLRQRNQPFLPPSPGVQGRS